jgi:transposase
MDFRKRVMALYDRGMRTAQIVEIMGCSAAWARRLKQRRREMGTVAPLASSREYPRIYQDQDERRIRELIASRPDATLAEVIQVIGKPASLPTVCRALARLELSRKKSRRMPRNRIGRM